VEEIAAKEACGKKIELWFQDEARVGQKNKITRRWAKRGTRPSAPHDQRTASAYIFGAICPADGKGAGLVLPSCNSEAMALHLEEISLAVAPGAHALVLLDQAGWHVSAIGDSQGSRTLTSRMKFASQCAIELRTATAEFRSLRSGIHSFLIIVLSK
jgi:hypothetical protein